jgi:hypothetical protein
MCVKFRIQVNRLLIYKTTLKSIWISGIEFWGTAYTSNILILERYQSEALRMTVDERLGMCQIRLSEGMSKYQQLQTKSAATALNTLLASAHSQMT